ncbi:hypothetical protein [Streptomyces spiralis]
MSAGPSAEGALSTFGSGASSATTVCGLGIGCEDLSYHSSGAAGWAYSESVIWNVSEYAGKRYVYAVHADGSSPHAGRAAARRGRPSVRAIGRLSCARRGPRGRSVIN